MMICKAVRHTNVFDFDNTLYRGESAVDFAFFMMKSNKRILRWLPSIFWNLLKYKFCLVTREKMEKTINVFMKDVLRDSDELFRLAEEFWKTHGNRLDEAMLARIHAGDVILSAGPDFLLKEIGDRLGTSHILCSEVDLSEKKIVYLNFGSNKVKRFREVYGETAIEAFYTDSYNDRALMEISDTVFLVTKGKLKQIK